MKEFDIFRKTGEFQRMKLGLGLLMTLMACVLYAVMVALPMLASTVLSFVMLPFWAALTLFLCKKIYHAIGYRIDAGHLGIITGAITEGYIPGNASSIASDMVTERFRGEKHYFQMKRLVSRAVIQLNTVFSKASSLVGEVPGMKMMVEFVRLIMRLQLSYMTYCCMAYTFFRGDESLYVSASEGCAVYALNWKRLVKKNGDVTTSVAAGFLIGVTLLFSFLFVPLFGLFRSTPEEIEAGAAAGIDIRYAGVLLAFMIALVIKYAFLDSWYLVHYIHTYMHLAEYSAPGQDFYRRLSGESSAFGQLMNLANGKMPTPKKAHTFANAARRRNRTNIARRQPDAAHPIICPRCRNANLKNACYCESCGLKLR